MAVENFTTVNRRIEEERRTKYCGTASIRIASLKYRDPAHDGVTGPKNNHVDAMKRMFRQERGCRKEDSRHHVKALIPQQALEAAVARASIPKLRPHDGYSAVPGTRIPDWSQDRVSRGP